MKRLLVLLLILALVGVVSATSLNFQNPGDYAQIEFTNIAGSGWYSWVESNAAGNNYVSVGADGTFHYTVFHLKNPSQTTYAAATLVGTDGWLYNDGYISLMDSSKNKMYSLSINSGLGAGRYEVKISGGIPKIYKNGVVVATGAALAQNPSYVGFGTGTRGYGGSKYWDNYVYGETENKNIMGISESDNNVYYILDDIINPAKAGVYNESTDTTVQSTYMPSTWARGNLSTPLENQTIQLVSYPGNTVYATYYTGNDTFSGTINVDIKTYLIDAGAFDGYYAMYMPGTGAYSNVIMKKSNGATVSFNADKYSTGDTATIITYVASGGYWDTSTYNYKLSLYGLSAGYVENYTISSQSGTFTHAWESTDAPGVYYALLYATSRSTGQEFILGLDWAELSSYAGYSGTVIDAQTGLPIEGAFVNMTQDGVSGNSTSGFDGNWSSSSVFSTGSTLMINASASGYVPYNHSWIPQAAKTVTGLNVSMVPLAPSYNGLAIGGVVRDFLYGRPISGATVTVRNTTTALYCYKTTSFTGWYLNDETDCLFESKTPYDVWAYKIGYTNSTTEQAVTV
jgi:hypothetical protein